MAIHSQVINCTATEVAAMVEGAMHHGTGMDVEANYTDTHGQSVVGLGLTRLLGFDLLPGSRRSTGSGSTVPARAIPTPGSPRRWSDGRSGGT